MDCAACGHTISEGVKFCSQCGAPVGRACRSCGHDLRPQDRFCEQCGTAAEEAAEPASGGAGYGDSAVRKTVTVLFADLVGSTAFGERVDAESTRDVLADYHALTRSVIEGHGGFLAKFIGDGVMALFGVPATAEDDAIRAVGAGMALQAGFARLHATVADRHRVELGLRVGINTGEVVIAAGDDDVVGDALNTAARLEAACAPGRVLVGEETWRLARSTFDFDTLGSVTMKGKADPIATYQVVAAGEGDDDLGTPFVGRADELARMRQAFDRAVVERGARLVTVIGSPGVGKTRLSREFALSVGDAATVVEMRCRRSGTATFAPVAEWLRAAADIGDDDTPEDVLVAVRSVVADLDDADRAAELLAGLVGVGPDRSTEEAFFAVRRLVESQARRHPLVLVVDDIQWAEPLFLDLLEHLVRVGRRRARSPGLPWPDPEIREIRPTHRPPTSRTVHGGDRVGGPRRRCHRRAGRPAGRRLLTADPSLVGRLPGVDGGEPAVRARADADARRRRA